MKYKALSVRQPYAAFIEYGFKTIELRTWYTDYRGPLLICSPQGVDIQFNSTRAKTRFLQEFPIGQAICLVDLVDVRRTKPNDADFTGEKQFCEIVNEDYNPNFLVRAKNQYSWILENPRSVTIDFPVKGKLNLFTVEIDEDLIETAEEAILSRKED